MKNVLVIFSVAILAALTTTMSASAASISSELDQCRNGGIGATPQHYPNSY